MVKREDKNKFLINLLDVALEVLALNEIGDIILLIVLLAVSAGLVLLHVLVALGELAEGSKAVGAKLVQDTGDELGEFLLLAVAVEGESVGGDGGVDYITITKTISVCCFPVIGWGWICTLRSTKVDDVSVLLEHVNLLDGLDGLDVHLLQGGLELLVVGTGGLVDLLDLAAGSTLASVGLLVFDSWVLIIGVGFELEGIVCVSWDANVCVCVCFIIRTLSE